MADVGSFRRDGSDTMIAGALAVGSSLSTLRARVLSCLYVSEMTDGELLEAYRQRYSGGEYRSLSTRRRELVDMGLVIDTGRRKRNPSSGVQNIIWALTSRPAQPPPSLTDEDDSPF